MGGPAQGAEENIWIEGGGSERRMEELHNEDL